MSLSTLLSWLKGKLQQRLTSSDSQSLTTLADWVIANCNENTPVRVLSYAGWNWSDCPLGTGWGTVVVFGNASTYSWLSIAYNNHVGHAYWNIWLAGTGTWAFSTWKAFVDPVKYKDVTVTTNSDGTIPSALCATSVKVINTVLLSPADYYVQLYPGWNGAYFGAIVRKTLDNTPLASTSVTIRYYYLE